MGIADGKPPVDEGRRSMTPAPSSHAARSVNARIQAGPVWMEIVRSDQLPEAAPETSLLNRMIAWRRTVPTSRLIAVGVVAAAAITGFSLASSPYRWPTLPSPVGGGGTNAISNVLTGGGSGSSGGDSIVTSDPDASSSNSNGQPAATVSRANSSPRPSPDAAPSVSGSIASIKITAAASAGQSSDSSTPSPTPSPSPSPSPSPTDSPSPSPSPSPTDTSVTDTAAAVGP
jgi:hypothetical protein